MNTLTCVYCGREYPEGTPPHGSQILTDHIKICEKHPMRQLEIDRAKLRKALIDLIGANDKQELESMESVIRVMNMPEKDRILSLNAINVLLETM